MEEQQNGNTEGEKSSQVICISKHTHDSATAAFGITVNRSRGSDLQLCRRRRWPNRGCVWKCKLPGWISRPQCFHSVALPSPRIKPRTIAHPDIAQGCDRRGDVVLHCHFFSWRHYGPDSGNVVALVFPNQPQNEREASRTGVDSGGAYDRYSNHGPIDVRSLPSYLFR